ncbi:MAG: hypothetical protein NC123_03895 [Butyrivibrio sp.]|nr:hypothetical protein [Butyrivibrio sp.]
MEVTGSYAEELNNLLTGKRFNRISRALDMLCLFIGDDHTFISRGKEIPVSEFAFHFQTQWRFTDGCSIILGSRDIYEPFSHTAAADWKYDIIGREEEESSVFDVNAKKLNSAMKNAVVTDISVSPFGDVNIIFSDGTHFQSFTPSSRRDEEWRLIDYKRGNHMIL